jgi:Mn-containing catalase
MNLRVDRLQTELPPPSDPDPVGAAAVQELLGGKFGEMSTFMNYTYQSFNFRNRQGARPFYARALENLTGARLMKLFPSPRIPTEQIPECQPHIKRGEHLKLYRFSPADFQEIAAVFNGPHPETGEDLQIADEIQPEGAPPFDLPAQTAVFAPGPEPEEIAEIAAELRQAADLPKQPTGVVAGNGSAKAKASNGSSKAKRKTRAGAR